MEGHSFSDRHQSRCCSYTYQRKDLFLSWNHLELLLLLMNRGICSTPALFTSLLLTFSLFWSHTSSLAFYPLMLNSQTSTSLPTSPRCTQLSKGKLSLGSLRSGSTYNHWFEDDSLRFEMSTWWWWWSIQFKLQQHFPFKQVRLGLYERRASDLRRR